VSAPTSLSGAAASSREKQAESTAFRILAAISFCHLLNDMMQSVIPAVYPILKTSYHLDFGQIGLITLTGLVLLASAPTFSMILVAMVGMGSSVFHPGSSRIARMASGGQHGLAQSLFQAGPLLLGRLLANRAIWETRMVRLPRARVAAIQDAPGKYHDATGLQLGSFSSPYGALAGRTQV
jgi:hypothetical protein